MVVPSEDVRFLHETEMGLGAWAWGDRMVWGYGNGYTDFDIAEAFSASQAAGITMVDTAEVYGRGRSEELLGRFMKESDRPAYVATKFFPYPWRLRPAAMERALRGSLERLGRHQVDLYQIHWPFPPRSVEVWVEGLAEIRRKGLARAVGVSNFNQNQIQRAYSVLAKYDIPLASNQVEYHLLKREIEKNGLLARCQELGIRVIAYSPLAQGLLTGKYTLDNLPTGSRRRGAAKKIVEMQPLLKQMIEIGQDQGGKTPAQVAINWVICKGALPIPGAKTGAQAEMNLGAMGWRLTPEQIQKLDEAADRAAADGRI